MKPQSSKVDKRRHAASQSASQQPALWSQWLRAVSVGMGTVLCAMVLLGASGQDDESDRGNRKKIESMTSSERARLKRNYEKFQKLSAEEKQRLRKIHAATQNQPELDQVMRSYCNWVKTLSPWEQEDLRNAKTSQKRMELIRKFRIQNAEALRRAKRPNVEMLKILGFNSRDPRIMRLLWMNSLPPDLYNEVIGIIEESLPRGVEYPKPKESLSDFERSLAVLKTVAKVKAREKQAGDSESDWPPQDAVERIFQLSREPRKTGPPSPNYKRQKVMVSGLIVKGLLDQLFQSTKSELDQESPSDEKLQKFFESELGDQAKDNLMKFPPDEMQESLKYLYLQKHPPEEVIQKIRGQAADAKAVIFQFFGDGGNRGSGKDKFYNRGGMDRFPDMKGRRKNGPKSRGERPFREQKPGQRPFGKPRKPSGA